MGDNINRLKHICQWQIFTEAEGVIADSTLKQDDFQYTYTISPNGSKAFLRASSLISESKSPTKIEEHVPTAKRKAFNNVNKI